MTEGPERSPTPPAPMSAAGAASADARPETRPDARAEAPADANSDAGAEASDEMRGVREEVERIDRELIALIAERVRLARRLGEAKRAAGLPVLDPAREAAVVRRASALAREAGVPEEDVRYIFWHLIGLARRAQLEVG